MKRRGKIESLAYMRIERGDDEIELTLSGEGYYDPGVLSGPADRCYPPEGEMDLISIETEDGLFEDKLTDKEYDRAIDLLWENYEFKGDDRW